MESDPLSLQIEAIIFCATESITVEEIQAGLEDHYQSKIETTSILASINSIKEKFSSDNFSFEVIHVAGGYQFLTKPAFQSSVGSILKQKIKKRLSTSAMETLAIIAYRQPVSKPELEKIRGVNCDYAIQKLLEKELIEIAGKSDGPGRPTIYRTSKKFMDYFGINHIGQLPELKELEPFENKIGEDSDQ